MNASITVSEASRLNGRRIGNPESRAEELALEAMATLDRSERTFVAAIIDIRARRANIKAALIEMNTRGRRAA